MEVSLGLSFGIADGQAEACPTNRKERRQDAAATKYGPKTETPRRGRGTVFNRNIVPRSKFLVLSF
jgi:hypothetical protein